MIWSLWSALLRNRDFGALAVTVLPIPLTGTPSFL
jgi:hypothetical protein